MNHAKRRAAAFLLVLATVLCFLPVFPASAVSPELAGRAVFSHGLEVFAAMTDMAVSAPLGNDIPFCADDFMRAMNLSSLEYVTVRTLPPVTDGELLLASTRVAAGERIPSKALSSLVFVPSSPDVRRSSFTFDTGAGGASMVCNLYFLTAGNVSPTVSMASSLSLSPRTHVDLCSFGTLSAFDPDGDALRFEIVSYPKNGSVRLLDASTGSYVYCPDRSFTGTDRFSYVVRDLYGNYSASAPVTVTVSPSATSVVYADLCSSPEYLPVYNAALTLTEEGIMSGRQVGSDYYFDPSVPVSRSEFLVMAMNAVGITQVPACSDTGFFDDSDIPAPMKGYVAAACRLGYIHGTDVDGSLCFLPDSSLTRSDAAVILSSMLGLSASSVTPTFADTSSIPAWARSSIYSLHAAGILSPDVLGQISPVSLLTRADAALLLASVLQFSE